jgi:hypothetical protein
VKRRAAVQMVEPGGAPGWVLASASCSVVGLDEWLLPGERMTRETWWPARHRRREAAEAWCAERGLSYVVTVLGWAHAHPHAKEGLS